MLAAYGASVRSERYASSGVELAVDVFEPTADAGTADGRHPAILFFHGGGWRNGDRSQFHPQCERFAAAGFVAATAQYRLGVSIAACVDDAVAALAWMRAQAKQLSVDADRIAVGGGSAGGHLALCLATCPDYAPSPPVLAVVAFNPAVDLAPLAGYTNFPHAGADPAAMSPLHHVGASTPPVLIQHGTADQVIPIDLIRQFRDGAGACEVIEYEGARHGFFNRGASEAHFEATTAAAIAFSSRVARRQPA
jgi:acetyl esterase/lipase